MPCATIHMLTAGRVLRDWADRPGAAPFAVQRPELRRAFLLGAMGPDMGFVPGTDRFLSELSHYVSTGDLVRSLLEEADAPRETAFAWGWATHHLTDVQIHPLVGRACGEHVLGDRSVRLNSSRDCRTHVAMEVGLDLVFLASEEGVPSPPAGPLGSAGALSFLGRALEKTYRIPWDRDRLHRHHAVAAARTGRWPEILGLLGRARRFDPRAFRPGPLPLVLGPLLDVARRVLPSGGAAEGFLAPLRPPSWLVQEVRRVADAFPERFAEVADGGMAGVENRNLETGLLETESQDHPDSERAVRRLRDRLRSRRAPGREAP